MASFTDWFDRVEREAKDTEVGKLAIAAGYHVSHTGGSCLAWARVVENDRYLWICDEGNGLGNKVDEPYLVGYYDENGEALADATVPNLRAALQWCEPLARQS